jgi:hypothetical protein
MSNLKEKLREVSNPLTDDTISLSNYLEKTRTATEARRTLAHERDEPLPSMFRDADFRSIRDTKALVVAPSENAPTNFYPYVAAALFLSLAGAAAVYFTAANSSTDKGAVNPISKADVDKAAIIDRGVTTTAAFLSAAVDKVGLETQSTPSSPAEHWSDTVDTFKQLLAEQKASQAPGLQQSEADRVLGQLEAWSKAKAR